MDVLDENDFIIWEETRKLYIDFMKIEKIDESDPSSSNFWIDALYSALMSKYTKHEMYELCQLITDKYNSLKNGQ